MLINITTLKENLRFIQMRSLKLLALLLIVFLFSPLYAQKNDAFLNIHKNADLIVHAKVIGTQSNWINDSRGNHIYTTAELQVFKTLKGSYSPGYINLETVGGTVGEITEVASNSYIMKKGDEYILFLQSNPMRVIEGNQGIITAYNNKITLASKTVTVDEFVATFSNMLNNKINIRNIEEFESAAILSQMKAETAPSDSIRKAVLDKKNSQLNGNQSTAAPNILPYKPSAWGDKIVVKKNTITTPIGTQLAADDTPLYDSDFLYFAFAFVNNGDADAGTFTTKIYIDGALVLSGTRSSLQSGYYAYWYNSYVGQLSAGSHTLRMVTDSENSVAESNETDNEYTRSLTIQHLEGNPLITSITPVTVSAGTGTNITISGSRFGATQGTGVVDFFYQAESPRIQATNYISWSDNQIVCEVPIGTVNGYFGSAASGPVTVLNSAGRSIGVNISVTFGYGGVKWPGAFPVILYNINENCPSVDGEGNAIIAAMNTWNSAGVNFRFNYGGPTTATTSGYNSENSIVFGTTSSSIATNYYWYSGSNLVESDIILNASLYSFSTTGSAGTYDIQSIMTHELGHALNLRDLYGTPDADKIMYGYGSLGATKRNLTSGDNSGIQYIYGTGGTLPDYTISGLITYGGVPMSGVLVSMTGSSSQSLTTSTGGNYSFPGLIRGNYTITPTKTGYMFSPASQTFSALGSNQTQNFTASIAQYTIAASAGTNGSISPSGSVNVIHGANQTFTITPNAGYHISSVLVDGVSAGTVASYTFSNVTTGHTISASFAADSFTISLSANPSMGGTVGGAGSFPAGTSATVTATPNSGYTFTNWTEGATVVSTSSSYTFTLSGNRTLTANFAVAVTQYTVSLSSNPGAGGTTSGGGTFDSGTNVTVTATPNSGYTFTNWTEGATVVSTSSSYTFTLSGNRTLVANFTVIATQYTVNLSSNPGAGGTTSGGGTFDSGTNVTVTATPNSGYTFTNWTEGATVVSTSSSYTFTLSGNRTLVANFTVIPPTQFSVILSSNPAAGGTTSGGGTFDAGTGVTVTATPNSGYTFVNWTEGATVVSTSTSYTFSLTANKTLVANFALIRYTVSTSCNPTAGGTSGGGGTFDTGTSVTVTATANSGYTFTNWTEGATVVSTNSSYTFTLTGNKTLVANFALIPPVQYTVTLLRNPTAGGTISGGGTFDTGTSVTVTATANSGYTFANWTEGATVVSTSTSYTFTLTGNRNLTANFTATQYTVTLNSDPAAGGTTSGGGTFDAGTSVTVTATPNNGYQFLHWTEGGTIISTNTSYTFVLNHSRGLTAVFNIIVAIEDDKGVPSSFKLLQNYPNPFNPTTQISYIIKNSDYVKIVISDLTGRVVETLVDEYKGAGTHQIRFNAGHLPSGTYLYTIYAGSFTQTKKLMLLK